MKVLARVNQTAEGVMVESDGSKVTLRVRELSRAPGVYSYVTESKEVGTELVRVVEESPWL